MPNITKEKLELYKFYELFLAEIIASAPVTFKDFLEVRNTVRNTNEEMYNKVVDYLCNNYFDICDEYLKRTKRKQTIKFFAPGMIVKEIIKPTKAEGFKDLKVGDIIYCSILPERTTGASNDPYATQIKIEDRKNNIWWNSQNQFLNNIQNFIFSEVTNG